MHKPAWMNDTKRPMGRPRGQSKYAAALREIGHPATLEDIVVMMQPNDQPQSRKAAYVALYQLYSYGSLERRGDYWGLPGTFDEKEAAHVD